MRSDFERFDLILGMDMIEMSSDSWRSRRTAPATASHLFMDYRTGLATARCPIHIMAARTASLAVYRMIREASEALADRLDCAGSAPASGHASSTI